MKKNILLVFVCGGLFFSSCRKDKNLVDQVEENSFGLKSSNQSFDRLASFDATHNVLVFNSFEDVGKLEIALSDYAKNYPYDGRSTATIFDKIESIRSNGYTNGNTNNGRVQIGAFETLLLESFPLSDSVLKALIDLNDEINPKLPPPFMRAVLTANVPFTYAVSDKVINSEIPQGIKNQIIEAHDAISVVPDLPYEDFLSLFPTYNSLYKKHENDEKVKLESGMEPGAPGFYTDFVNNPFLSLILNSEKEVYVEGHLIKLYNDCKTAIFQNGLAEAYDGLAFLDESGFAEIPNNIIEPITGLTIGEMAEAFPMNYALIDLNYIDFNDEDSDDPIGLTEFNSFEIIGCPQSSFSFGWESSDEFDVQFDNLTDEFFPGNTIYHYWQFGDGTGSFLANPHHMYSEPGTYTVKLTSFTADCGCWDVQHATVTIPDPAISGTKDCFCNVDVNVQGVLDETGIVVFTPNAFDDIDLSAYGVEYHWFFGDGLFEITTDPIMEHYYPYAGDYTATLYVKLSNDCYTNVIEIIVNIPNDDPNICCDKRQNLSTQPWVFSYDGTDNYKLTTNDSYTGNDMFLDKIHGCQKLWRKKSNGNWTGQKGRHDIYVGGVVYFKDEDDNQTCADAGGIGDHDGIYNKAAFDFPCYQEPFGVVQEHTINVVHQVWVNSPYGYFTKTIVMGEQNCD